MEITKQAPEKENTPESECRGTSHIRNSIPLGPYIMPHEPSALYCWMLKILYCNPKGRRALLRIPSTEGRSVCLCWEHSKQKGPKRLSETSSIPAGYTTIQVVFFFILNPLLCNDIGGFSKPILRNGGKAGFAPIVPASSFCQSLDVFERIS